jgi:hypothetical protein
VFHVCSTLNMLPYSATRVTRTRKYRSSLTRATRSMNISVACDLVRLLLLSSRSRRALAAENLFLRKQLALFQERRVRPHRAHDSTRLVIVILGRMFSWRDALVNVKPDTFLRWHRKGFRLTRNH